MLKESDFGGQPIDPNTGVYIMKYIIKRLRDDDSGMTTAEYAVGTVAAASLGGVLIKLLSSEEVRNLLWQILQTAFSFLLG